MAILSKIRERSVYLILIIGLALLAFVIDPSKIQSFFSSSGTNEVGQINGEEINRKDFAEMLENYQSRSGGRTSQMQAVNTVWENLVREKVYENQIEESGVVVGEKDIWDGLVSMSQIQQSPIFKNEAGLFSEDKLKEYIENLKAQYNAGKKDAWLAWLESEKNIKNRLKQQAYNNMVLDGLGISSKESQLSYNLNNATIDAKYVYVPYETISDSLVKVSQKEIKSYVDAHPKEFKKGAARTLKYVTFAITPSEEDDNQVKQEVAGFINDREEYNEASKSKITVKGLKNTSNLKLFFEENGSDVPYGVSYLSEKNLPKVDAVSATSTKINDIIGPYKEKDTYKLTKIIDIIKMPDSVKASHIIVPFVGAARAQTTVTKQQAKKTVDSLLAIISKTPKQFSEIADKVNTDGSKGKGGEIGWISRESAFSPYFDKDFANYIFFNKKGNTDIVLTQYGYHIIRVDDQKNFGDAYKTVTFGRATEPSEQTENDIFQKAETLALKLTEGKKIQEASKENNYYIQDAENIKELDEKVPGIGNQRRIVNWAFNKDTKIGDSKRFDIEYSGKRGYVVVELTGIVSEDEVAISGDVLNKVTPILQKAKKAQLIAKKISGATLDEVAKNTQTEVKSISGVTFESPLLTEVGNEPKVVGVMSAIPVGKLSDKIEGEKGVFVVEVTNRKQPENVEGSNGTYELKRKVELQQRAYKIYDVLKEKANIEDQRGKFF